MNEDHHEPEGGYLPLPITVTRRKSTRPSSTSVWITLDLTYLRLREALRRIAQKLRR